MTDRGNGLGCLAALIRRRDRVLCLKIGAQIVFGALLTLTGPAVLATIFWFAARSLGQFHVPWLWAFGTLLVIMVPLLFHLELRTGGHFLDAALRENPPSGGLLSPMPGMYVALGGLAWAPALANPRGFSAGAAEIFLCGPRLLITASRQRRIRRRLGKVDVRRAARLLADLAVRAEGLELSALPKAAERLDDLLPVLNWLAFQEWIGVGEQVPRVYLYSEARAAIRRAAGRDDGNPINPI